jgi:hypothetical protein
VRRRKILLGMAGLLLLGNIILFILPRPKEGAVAPVQEDEVFLAVESREAKDADYLRVPGYLAQTEAAAPPTAWSESVELVYGCRTPRFLIDLDITGYQAVYVDQGAAGADILTCIRRNATDRLYIYSSGSVRPSYRMPIH